MTETLTIKQAAELLQVAEPTVRRLARDCKLPASKIGREWRLLRIDLLEYIRSQYQSKNDTDKLPCSTNAKTRHSGGSKSQLTASKYSDLLKLPTAAKRKNSMTH